MADAFATPNNLNRLNSLGVDSGVVKNMAAREDAIASSSNRILGGSDTARTDLAKNTYIPPGASVTGNNAILSALLGASGYAAMSNPVLGVAMGGGAFGLKKLAQVIADSSRNRVGSASAELFARQGPAVKQLLDALEKAKIAPRTAKSIRDSIISQSLVSGQSAAVQNRNR
jgi:hypothetical protein